MLSYKRIPMRCSVVGYWGIGELALGQLSYAPSSGKRSRYVAVREEQAAILLNHTNQTLDSR